MAVTGLGGWLIPALIAMPLAFGHESAGGEAALFAGIVWLLALAPIGCLVSGWLIHRRGRSTDSMDMAFWIGLATTASAVVVVAILGSGVASPVLHATVGFACIATLPLVIAYLLGFGVATLVARRA